LKRRVIHEEWGGFFWVKGLYELILKFEGVPMDLIKEKSNCSNE